MFADNVFHVRYAAIADAYSVAVKTFVQYVQSGSSLGFRYGFRNHLKSFRNAKYANDTELSKHVWKLKMENRQFNIKWSVIKQVAAYKPGARRCNLCLEEKLQIMKARKRHKHCLNKRTELFTNCRHVT